ncbi:NAD(P)H-dependent flavin oxidoreductase [Salimicrobium flavidum]|uniref:Probable nitronate monooxygenase n=1 Tax=Salimicrobium flavidum TaxID=570947 RepID=A0A1N7ILY5_9BACI|nr:nitronate monooxygenase [Salimicrobium flavidum]SIS38098.1 2-nitropropane dioxygenase precursor [Salimicrobium flavidum]
MNWKTKITELLSIRYPVIQGGLAYLAYSELASAVSNAGGLGQITAMSLESPEKLREEIHKTRNKTVHPFGVNFAIGSHGRPYEDMVQVAIEEQVPVVSVTGGNPKGVLDMLSNTGIKKLVLVAAKRQAKKAEELGADAVMVVGQEGGGHIGRSDTGTFILTPEVVDTVEIPVIASGGISDGRGVMAALALGAEGVEMGTRFIATKECLHAHEKYKQSILDATDEGTTVIKISLGTPARVLANDWTDQILALEKQGADYDKLKTLISGEANKSFIHMGLEKQGFGWAGQVSARIHEELSVQQLFDKIKEEADYISDKWR